MVMMCASTAFWASVHYKTNLDMPSNKSAYSKPADLSR